MAGSRENVNEASGSIKLGNLFKPEEKLDSQEGL